MDRHPNAMLLADHLDALARGAIAKAMSFYADDVVFHYPGHNQLSGDFLGKPAVLELMGRVVQLTAGSFRPEVHDILASDDHVAALV
ncbi:MAG: nuclear transport factor 2 family protein, partial [Chloroflexi bacterium]|nr:nuclear transport factor 2 family protein [Chloroflexota bacterium]